MADGTEYLENIDGIYFDSVSTLLTETGSPIAGKFTATVGLISGTVKDLVINYGEDPDNPGKVIVSTIGSNGTNFYLSGKVTELSFLITRLTLGAAAASFGIATSPLWLAIGAGTIAIGATTYLFTETKIKDLLYEEINGFLEKAEEDTEMIFNSPNATGTITKEEFIIESVTNDLNFAKKVFPQYLNYKQRLTIKSGTTLVDYFKDTKEATIVDESTDADKNIEDYISRMEENGGLNKAEINEITYTKRNISDYTDLEIRNIVSDIYTPYALLSNITIKVDEKIDLKEKGIYTVKSGDTFSEIANDNGFTTKELLEANTWLIDDNRIKFNDEEIFVNSTALRDNTTKNHLLVGTNADDILRDLNGGDDVLVGGQGVNILDGGEGNDTVSYATATTGINVNISSSNTQAINVNTIDNLISVEKYHLDFLP